MMLYFAKWSLCLLKGSLQKNTFSNQYFTKSSSTFILRNTNVNIQFYLWEMLPFEGLLPTWRNATFFWNIYIYMYIYIHVNKWKRVSSLYENLAWRYATKERHIVFNWWLMRRMLLPLRTRLIFFQEEQNAYPCKACHISVRCRDLCREDATLFRCKMQFPVNR